MLSLVLFYVLVLIQLSMALFIVIHGRKEKSFRQAFYTLFVSVTFAECLGVLSYPIFFCRNYQPLCHAIISINRLTAFAFPFRHSSIWSRRTLIVTLVAMSLTSTALAAFAPVCRAITTAGREHILPTISGWDIPSLAVAGLFHSMNLVLTSAASFALNLSTVIMFVVYRRRAANNKQQQSQHRQDVRLFVYTVYMLLVQVVLAFIVFVETTDYFTTSDPLFDVYGAKAWFPRWLRRLRLDSKKWLFGDADCSESTPLSNGDYGVEDEESCGFVYNLLHSDQLSTLNVISFMEDLYSLSSGTVRKAYLEFYGEAILGCLQRSQRQRVVPMSTSSSSSRR